MADSSAQRYQDRRSARDSSQSCDLEVSSLRRRLAVGATVALLFVVTAIGLGSLAELSGAVIAPGTVVVETNSKKVQHAQGGIVSEIMVRNGSRVAAGDILLRLDDTQARASLGIISSQLAELTGRKTRLVAERDNAPSIAFADPFILMAGGEVARIMEGEARLFRERRAAAESRKAQLLERISQLEEEIKGSTVQHRAKLRELGLIKDELSRTGDMYRRDLVPITRLISLQREEARIDGENGTLIAQIARLKGQIAEIRLQIGAIDQTISSDAQKEIREIEGRIAELQDRRVAAEDQLRRIDMRSPIDGVVHELITHTVGGVIAAGEQLMLIVPHHESLSIEVRIQTTDIDQIHMDQVCILRFPAFHQQFTPEGTGRITRLAPDASHESQTGHSYFVARIAPDMAFLATRHGRRLVPGMPVEVFVETASRSVLSYAMKPLIDQFERAFRER
jgi:membrane fusion protein, type I secretion system